MTNFQIRINYNRRILLRYVIFMQYIIYSIFNVGRHNCCVIVQLFVSCIKRCEKQTSTFLAQNIDYIFLVVNNTVTNYCFADIFFVLHSIINTFYFTIRQIVYRAL